MAHTHVAVPLEAWRSLWGWLQQVQPLGAELLGSRCRPVRITEGDGMAPAPSPPPGSEEE